MTLAWYDPTNQHVSTNKNDPMFTPLGQLWPLGVKREWVGLIRGVRVEGDTVIITVNGSNDVARSLCGELLKEKNNAND